MTHSPVVRLDNDRLLSLWLSIPPHHWNRPGIWWLPLRATLGQDSRGDTALRHPHRGSVSSHRGFLCLAPAQGPPHQPPDLSFVSSPFNPERELVYNSAYLVRTKMAELECGLYDPIRSTNCGD